MMKFLFYGLTIALIIVSASCSPEPGAARHVNPFVGSAEHGHTYPGAVTPFGMAQLSPDTRLEGWDACSGYHYSDNAILGFSHTHLNGTGVQDYLDILFSPTTGPVLTQPGSPHHPKTGYMSHFDHKDEKAEPGYYRVLLKDFGIIAELTATPRVGVHQYTFPASPSANIIIDLTHGDQVIDSFISFENDREIKGFRKSDSWAKDQRLYFFARFSRPFDATGVDSNGVRLPDTKPQQIFQGKNIKAFVSFRTHAQEVISVKVGLSAVSIEGARKNLEAEAAEKTFSQIRTEARSAWNQALGKIRVSGGSPSQTRTFFTALYHCLINPNIYSDTDGRYRGRDMDIHQTNNFDYYTVFSLWDTFRAFHPLMTIIEPERSQHFIRTFLFQYQDDGLLPVWELSSNETFCMIGYHSVPVIADAFMKQLRAFDAETALSAMRDSSNRDHFGLCSYREHGFLRADDASDSVSKTLEYAYDDWCIAQMAKALGKHDIYEEYIQRAQYYKNLFDPGSGFMRARVRGSWIEPFDPREVNFNYTEANAWQYSFFVPHDISGLAELMGGNEAMTAKLDALFNSGSKTTGRHQVDITGLIGQYAHGNEPSHHIAYLYDYLGSPWKTQQRVRQIMDTLYSDTPDGLCGNEDCGQMSAWFVFSALGFYPVTPGANIYAIGTPLFPEAVIQVNPKRTFTITAPHVSPDNIYIQSARLNGKPWTRAWIRHEDIVAGGTLEFIMGPQPNRKWGTGPGDAPVSAITDYPIVIIPHIVSRARAFRDATEIVLAAHGPNTHIFYTLDTADPSALPQRYEKPIRISQSTVLRAFAQKDHRRSKTLIAHFDRIPANRNIRLLTPFNSQYSAGGDSALIDGLHGAADFKIGAWQGFWGDNLEAIIDLGKTNKISLIRTGFLQDIQSWIFFPLQVDYQWSNDGRAFSAPVSVINTTPQFQEGAILREFSIVIEPITARFIKISAKNIGVCPPWHKGAGNKAWIFADEIIIE